MTQNRESEGTHSPEPTSSIFDISEVGKRLSTADPLGPHDVAARLDKAAVRLWRILLLIEGQGDEYAEKVRRSRYLTNALDECALASRRFLDDPDSDPMETTDA